MKKKRILFLNCTLGLGGVERSLCDVLRNMDFSKYDVDLYLDSSTGGLSGQIPANITLVHPNAEGTYGRFKTIFLELLRNRQYGKLYLRIIKKISHYLGPNVYTLLKPLYAHLGTYDAVIAYREGNITQFAYHAFKWKKFIGWWHYGEVPESNKEYDNLPRISHVIAVSASSKEKLCSKFDVLKDKVQLIPNMVDVDNIRKLSTEYDPHYDKSFLHISTVARLSPEKHIENALFCASKLVEKGLRFKWHVIGVGPSEKDLTNMIQSRGLNGIFILEGGKNNPYPHFLHSDLYVHPSYVESQGLTVLEAMALGIPCVVTKSLGPCEFIEDGVNGILTEQCPEDLSEKVLNILSDTSLYKQIKSNTQCPDFFLPRQVMKKITSLLEDI